MAVRQKDIDDHLAAKDAYFDNADWFEADSTTKAGAFITAVTRLIGLLPQQAEFGRSNPEVIRFDLATLQRERTAAKAWLQVKRRNNSNRGGFRNLEPINPRAGNTSEYQ